MENKGNPRRRFKFDQRAGMVLVLVVLVVLNLVLIQEKPSLTVAYGKFKQILNAPGVAFRNVKVAQSEIRGEIRTQDRVSGLDPAEVAKAAAADGIEHNPNELVRVTSLRAPRIGVDLGTTDPQLFTALNQRAPGFQGDDEVSPVNRILGYAFFGLMMIATLILSLLVMRWMFGNVGGGMFGGFGRKRHQLYAHKDENRVTFEDVAGVEEAKAELLEVVDFLKKPEKYKALGGRIPKGVLLIGPPGTGKTLLARSVAGEAGVPFFNISGSDFVELFVGMGASRVRELFRDAEQRAPCIIFIDELDALGKSRTTHGMGSHEEREQTLNQLLVEMDGFDPNRGVIIMGATNRPEVLDAALLRPGRFDRTVVVDRPDIHGREAILKVHSRNVKIADDVNLKRVAALTPGSVGADLANLVNEAALLAVRRGRDAVTMKDFDEAVERGAVGLERKSRIMRPEEKRRVAVHEAGHALVACAVPGSDPVHKVSIIPRGLAGGYVLQRPESDRLLLTRSELEARIKVSLGGTIAEEITLGEISTGATSDLQKANDIAARMVREFGMSRMGRIYLSPSEGPGFLPGFSGDGQPPCSEETAREIDLEVRRIVEQCLDEVRNLLNNGRSALDAVAQRLIEREVIEGRDLLELLESHGFEPNVAAKHTLENPPAHQDLNGQVANDVIGGERL
jgi:cell division protease FtsH